MEIVRDQPGFLGTGATLLADLTLLAYILLLVPLMLVGFIFARRKKFEPYHKYVMTSIMLLNWVLIAFVMMVSFRAGVAPNIPQGLPQPVFLLPLLHLISGALAQLLATYLVLRMWFEDVLPGFLKVKRIKRYMRFTLFLWVLTALLGVSIYLVWYVLPSGAANVPDPAATPELNAPVVTPDLNLPVITPELGIPVITPEINIPVVTPEVQPTIAPAVEATATLPPLPTKQQEPVTTPEVSGG